MDKGGKDFTPAAAQPILLSDGTTLGERAKEHVEVLAGEIGPRPAGSAGEAQGREYAARQLQDLGYETRLQPIRFAPLPAFVPLYALAGLALVLGGWGISLSPWLGIWLPLLFAALPEISRWEIRRRPLTQAGANLYAELPGQDTGLPRLVLCAHLDTGRAIALPAGLPRRLYHRTLDIVQRAAIAIAALGVVLLLGLPLPGWVLAAAGLAGSLAGGWLIAIEIVNQTAAPHYSPGAVDNASGVGCVLALAEHYAHHSPGRLRLGYLLTGAEETGLHGARAFAESLAASPVSVRVICLDQVGAGDRLRYVSRDGTLFSQATDERLNQAILSAIPGASPLWHSDKSGDSAAFLRHGIPAAEIQASGSAQAGLAYHTTADLPGLVQERTLSLACQAIVGAVDVLKYELN